MKPFRLIKLSVVALTIGVAVTAGWADEPPDLNGRWKGVPAPGGGGGVFLSVDIVVSGTKMTFYSTGTAGAVTITIDNRKSPAWIDLTTLDSPSEKIKGIYQIDADKLTLAYSTRTGDRPVNFEGNTNVVMHFVRDGSATTRAATTVASTTTTASTTTVSAATTVVSTTTVSATTTITVTSPTPAATRPEN